VIINAYLGPMFASDWLELNVSFADFFAIRNHLTKFHIGTKAVV
jgi:hypothetical protein